VPNIIFVFAIQLPLLSLPYPVRRGYYTAAETMKTYISVVVFSGLIGRVCSFLPPAAIAGDAKVQHRTILTPGCLDLPCSIKRDGSSTAMSVKKKSSSQSDEKAGVDYGKVLALFVNPANPYSWFLYMLGFIIIYGNISGN